MQSIQKLTFANRTPLLLAVIAAGILVLIMANLAFGTVSIPLESVVNILFRGDDSQVIHQNILLRTRLPQTITALSAGVALSVAGLLMQTLFRNPLAGPSVLGISSGSSLGVAFVVLMAGQAWDISLMRYGIWGELVMMSASLLGALAVLALILMISSRVGGTLSVLIMGVMIGYLANSVIGILKFFSTEDNVHNYVMWGLGSFGRLPLDRALLFAMLALIPSALVLLLSKPLNLLALGDNYARNLGLSINKARFTIILASGILTAIVTTFCGPIVFIGMAVPHFAKMIARTSNHLHLLLICMATGALTGLFCNLAARLPGFDSELPINSVTAFIGAPVVISVILKRRKQSEE